MPRLFYQKNIATMNKRQDKQHIFAEVKLTDENMPQQEEPASRGTRAKFLKLIYPNDVTLVLPGDIVPAQLEQYIRIKV